MKKVVRSRKGFTLVEITLVIAIIVILASVSFVGIKAMLQNANKNSTAVELHAGAWYVKASDKGKSFDNDEAAADEGYYPYVINGERIYVKVVPKGSDEDAKYWSDWDDMYEQVRNINAVTPMPQSGGYTPGGSGGLNPGTGGSGGDNPGDNPGGGGTPELWNGHTEEWWNENDAKWEEKIQQLKDQGIPPENIHVTKDERGHITGVTWSNPTSGGGSSSSTGGGSGSGSGNGNGNGNGNSSTPSVGADSATKTLNAPSEYNLQASNQSFSGNGQPITKLTITISDGATFTNVSAYDNGGKYKMTKSDDNKTVTITFDSSLGWASPDSTLKVGNIQWSGSQNVQITYGFEYA